MKEKHIKEDRNISGVKQEERGNKKNTKIHEAYQKFQEEKNLSTVYIRIGYL